MPQRDITKEARDARARESEIARELRVAREDFEDALKQYRDLDREYHRMDNIHLKKVRRGEKENGEESGRLEATKNDLDKMRKCLNEKEKLLLVARSAEYNYRKHQYEMMKYAKRNPVSRFFSWISSIPTRIMDRITDTFILSAEARRINNLPEKERQEEIRKIRASYALDQAEKKMERAATTQAKEFIIEHPEVGIRNFNQMDVRQQDMIAMEKLIGLSARTGETLYLGIGKDHLLKIELMDEELNRDDGYVSVRLMSAGRDEEGKAILEEGQEIGHVHITKASGQWEVDLQTSSKTRLDAALELGRAELSTDPENQKIGIRKLTREEARLVAKATMDDAERKREALNRAFETKSPSKEEPEKGDSSKGQKDKEQKDKDQKDKDRGKGPEKGGEEPEQSKDASHGKEEPKEKGPEQNGKKSPEKDEPELTEEQENKGFEKGTRSPAQEAERRETEKNVEKAIRDLHKSYRKDKTLENHKHPVSITVDRFQVSICPPNAKYETPYYKIDGRYAGKYMKSMSNPSITMEYVRNHNLLDNPVGTISPEKLDKFQLEGNIARGLLYDVNHHTSDVPEYLSSQEVSGRDIDLKDVSRFMSSDVNKYPEQEAAQVMSDVYKKIQTYDMDDRYRDSKASSIYLDTYKSYMQKEELSHAGQFQENQVDYVAKDGTLFDKDGKLFLSDKGDIITLDNCTEHCPPEEKETIRESLDSLRNTELGQVNEEQETLEQEQPETREEAEQHEGSQVEMDRSDWLMEEEPEIDEDRGFPLGDDHTAWPPEEPDVEIPDFGLQGAMDIDSDSNMDHDDEER